MNSTAKLVRHFEVTVADTATQIPKGTSKYVVLKNDSGVDVFFGDSTVTTGTGVKVASGSSLSIDLNLRGGSLYAIVASGTADIQVLIAV